MKLLISFLFVFLNISIFGQNREPEILQLFKDYKYYNTEEFAYLKPDKQIFYSGESLEFDVVILNQYFSISELSRIVHVDLIHKSQDHTLKYVFRLNKGKTSGKINLPQDIPTGNYQMVAYTHFMRNLDLEYMAHRIPIYIQNVLDDSKDEVVRNINFQDESLTRPFQSKYGINVSQSEKAISLEIETPEENEFYLVSEGFKSVQLIAKIQPTGSITKFALPVSQFKGGFQRFILLNSNLEIVSIKPFYLQRGNSFARAKSSPDRIELSVSSNLVSKIALSENKGVLPVDPLSLFRRIYRMYFNIPLHESIQSMSFMELTSDSILERYSRYSYSRWNEIINATRKDDSIKFFPEKNITLSGRVEGETELVLESNVAIHLFENQLDIVKKVNENGEFSMDLILPAGQDYFKASVLNNSAWDVSEKVKLVFNEYDDLSYIPNVSHHPKGITDSIIESNLEFKYVLSTYSTANVEEDYFWKDIKFDDILKVSDYYSDIKTFEEFIKEAVMNVSVAEKQGEKVLKIYNYTEGTFDKPQLIVLDNQVLKNTSILFDVSLDSIESVNTAFNEETLKTIGKTFVKGIIVVKTKNGKYKVSNQDLDQSFKSFTGYTIDISRNEVSDKFNSSGISDLSFELRKEYILKTDVDSTKKLNVESFSKEGFYYNLLQEE